MPTKRPRFWVEILILGFMLVFGMSTLSAWLPTGWSSIARVLYAAALFGVYGLHYERHWGTGDR